MTGGDGRAERMEGWEGMRSLEGSGVTRRQERTGGNKVTERVRGTGGDKGRTGEATRIQVSSYTCSVAMSPSRRMISPTSSACPTRTSSYMAAPAMRMAVTTAGTLRRQPLVCPKKCHHCPQHAAIPGPETPCTAPSRLSFSMSAIRVPTSPSMVVALMAQLVAPTLYGDGHRRGLGGTGCTQCPCGCGLCTVNSTSPPVPTPHRHAPALTQLVGTGDNPDHHSCCPRVPSHCSPCNPPYPQGGCATPYQLQSWGHTSPHWNINACPRVSQYQPISMSPCHY